MYKSWVNNCGIKGIKPFGMYIGNNPLRSGNRKSALHVAASHHRTVDHFTEQQSRD